MLTIDAIVPASGTRLWQKLLIERLQGAGHNVAVRHQDGFHGWPPTITAILTLEHALLRGNTSALTTVVPEIPITKYARQPSLQLDLSGDAPQSAIPTLRLTFDGHRSDAWAAVALAEGQLPTIEVVLDDRLVVGRALPMVDRREFVVLGADDVMARAITLMLSVVVDFEKARLRSMEAACRHDQTSRSISAHFLSSYLGATLPRVAREIFRRARYHHSHWYVGYRFRHSPKVSETGDIGSGWNILFGPNDRFYADPFPFEWHGRTYIFVEDYSHIKRKAVISVLDVDNQDMPNVPQPVLEEPHHLSYPQVFYRNNAIWMLPEASAGGQLVLYRAEQFPDHWTPEMVLLEGKEISDATLLEHNGLLWLFATERDGYGSTSDTLVVFSAPALSGPWTPHHMNPVVIDRRMARPGGAFIHADGRIFLPIQDGTEQYGGGLGFAELLTLDEHVVRLSSPKPISNHGDWPFPRIHTYNQTNCIEVIDGRASVRKHSTTAPEALVSGTHSFG